MLKRLRTVLFWAHLSCGVTAGVLILMMCVTGVALTYQRQIQWWADTRHYRADPPRDERRASAGDLLAAAGRLDPSAAPTALTLRADPAAPAAVTLGPRTVYVNPYTAQLYGEGSGGRIRAFFTTMVNWHRYVGQAGDRRPTGKSITGAANLVFLAIVLSGMYLWWPRGLRWSAIRQVVWFRRGLPGKARDFNWHNTLGFWSALPLALIVFSGAVISYPWVSNQVYRAYGEPPPPPAGRGGSPAGAAAATPRQHTAPEPVTDATLDSILASAAVVMPDWNILVLRLPVPAEGPVTVTLDSGDGGQPHLRGTLTLDVDGRIEKWEDASSLTPGRRARNFLRFAHTGEVGGVAGQTVAGLVSAAGAVLVYTGMALALRRFASWRRRG
jgi:uncharacterized iron-regulated membrane protein